MKSSLKEPYEYQPFKESNESFIWNNEARKTLLDYNLEDLSI